MERKVVKSHDVCHLVGPAKHVSVRKQYACKFCRLVGSGVLRRVDPWQYRIPSLLGCINELPIALYKTRFHEKYRPAYIAFLEHIQNILQAISVALRYVEG